MCAWAAPGFAVKAAKQAGGWESWGSVDELGVVDDFAGLVVLFGHMKKRSAVGTSDGRPMQNVSWDRDFTEHGFER